MYGIYCDKCRDILYVGETGTAIYDRMANHLSSVRQGKDEPIPMHFSGEDHNISQFKWFVIEKIRREDIHHRKIRESFWIEKMKTLYPRGLNKNGGVGDQIRGIVM